MDTKKVLTHLIKAGRDALHLESTLHDIGYDSTPYLSLYGEISEAIYCMIGEDTETFEESLTHHSMNDIFTSDETCAEGLASMCSEPVLQDVPESTRNIIIETANRRGIDPQKMAMLILSEWAAKEILFQQMNM